MQAAIPMAPPVLPDLTVSDLPLPLPLPLPLSSPLPYPPEHAAVVPTRDPPRRAMEELKESLLEFMRDGVDRSDSADLFMILERFRGRTL